MKADITPDTKTAVDFLQWLRPGGPWLLIAIIPDLTPTAITASTDEEVIAFIHSHNGTRNLYFGVNPTRKPMRSKPAKKDIAAIEFLLADLDPREDEETEAAKARYLEALETVEPAPAALIDSGNGIQALWRLAVPIELSEEWTCAPGTNGSKKTTWACGNDQAATIADAEARCAALMVRLGGAAGTQNVDRILRLPGTNNIPNAVKREKRRVVCPSKLIHINDACHSLQDFPIDAASEEGEEDAWEIDWTEVENHKGWLKGAADLPRDFSVKGRMIIAHSGSIQDLNVDLMHAGLIATPYKSDWSSVTFALASVFKRDGRFSKEQIAAALMCPLACNKHITKLQGKPKRRAIERAMFRLTDPKASVRVAQALNWRECRADGAPIPSMHNARLTIAALGIDCRYDTFHNKMLFGYAGDEARHEIEAVLGEVSDNGIIRLRQIISERYGIDMGDRHARDAVVSLALEHCFDPVRDMLDAAQVDWDGIERLDEMAVTYFNCADTELNRAIIRKTMIAAVRRARAPGCKFDNITVLESPEGLMKSTAWRVLAGDENFSDASILGHGAREVQEQLAECWIHENADLAGLKKAEVETVKAFASRQSDDARPAYGHFLKKQKRHSIEVGTTNSDEYLQSQTGNRRFWPLEVLKAIDIELLKRDRLQLLGEAAAYEADAESITLHEELWPAAGSAQERRRVKDPWEDILADIPETHISREGHHYDIVHRIDGQERVASAALLTHVLGIPAGQQEKRHSMKLAEVMGRLGWERHGNKVTINGKQVRGYSRSFSRP